MPGDQTLVPEYIKTHLRLRGSNLSFVGMSLTGDEDSEARELGASRGASTVLKKARFEDQLIPAILSC
jgi:hypothetical protein